MTYAPSDPLPIRSPTELALHPHKVAMVGSRETPIGILMAMTRLARALCDAGYLIQSGEADGADNAAHIGARQSARYREVGFAGYLPWNGMKTNRGSIYADPSDGIFDASTFETWRQAEAIAFEARGSFEGLGRGGIGLHTRNAFQVLSPSLRHPVHRCICWAIPIGDGSKVRGGTNTAVQIALRYSVPVVNLYYEEVLHRVLSFAQAREILVATAAG